jgi:hypothetical protein
MASLERALTGEVRDRPRQDFAATFNPAKVFFSK